MAQDKHNESVTRGAGRRDKGLPGVVRRAIRSNEFSILAALFVLIILMSIAKPQAFLSTENIFNVLKGTGRIFP